MTPNEKQKQWNDQWWVAVVQKKKTALPPIHNVRPRPKRKKPTG